LTSWPYKEVPDGRNWQNIDTKLRDSWIRFAWRGEALPGALGKDPTVGLISSSGEVMWFRVSEASIENYHNASIMGDVDDYEFFSLGEQLLKYDRWDHTMVSFGTNQKWEPIRDENLSEIEIDSRLLAFCNSELVYCPNPFEVYRGTQRLCRSGSHIMALAANSRFGRVVFATADGRVHFHSSRKGNETMPPYEMGDVVDSVLITEKWGFVVMHSTQMLALSNLNGTPIKRASLDAPILKWTTFSSMNGFDYVAFVNTKRQIVAFEAFYPEEMTVIEEGTTQRAADVVCLEFDRISERLMVVMADGCFMARSCKDLIDRKTR
jgi:hypothetical protein